MTVLNRIVLFAWVAVLFSAAMWLFTRHQQFPFYYHPDEPGKVEQVLGERAWNFNHPMLLLGASKQAAAWMDARTAQSVVEAGRTVSAFFCAFSVVLLSLVAWRWAGWGAAIFGGLALLFHHQLFELAHYMKEDTAVLLGTALAIAGIHGYERRPGIAWAVFLGLACGVALAGKYIGVLALFVAAPVLWHGRRERSGVDIAIVLALTAAVFVAVNFPMLSDTDRALGSMKRESALAAGGQGGVTQDVPHTRYWSIFLANTTPVIWALLLVLLAIAARRRREWSIAAWTTLAFPFAFALMLSFFPKENDRYFLPASAVFTVLAAVGAHSLGGIGPHGRWLAPLAGVALVAAQFPSWTDDRGGFVRYWLAFQQDDTAQLVQWLRANVPPKGIIAKDEKVRLPDARRRGVMPGTSPLPHTILSEDFVADFGTVEQLRARGVTHVVITDNTFRRFERAGLKPKLGEEAAFAQRRHFYQTLRSRYAPVAAWKRSHVIYLHPGLEVYDISK